MSEPTEDRILLIPISQMSKWRLREVTQIGEKARAESGSIVL
jgi:hypothetical protein